MEVLRWLPEWLDELASGTTWSVEQRVMDVGSLGDNLLVGLRALNLVPAGTVLVLLGFEEAQRRAGSRRGGPLQQLNTQRDLLVSEFACPWILLMEQETDRLMRRIAPDFADFVALRVGPEDLELPVRRAGATSSQAFTSELAPALLSMFSTDELRRLLTYALPGGDRLLRELPDSPVSPAQFAHEAANLIRRHGLEAELLDAMEQVRPRRATEILRLRALTDLSAASSSTSPLVQAIQDLSLSSREELYAHMGALLQRRFSLKETTPQQLYDAVQDDPKAMSALIAALRDISSDRYS